MTTFLLTEVQRHITVDLMSFDPVINFNGQMSLTAQVMDGSIVVIFDGKDIIFKYKPNNGIIEISDTQNLEVAKSTLNQIINRRYM